jgi:hypothetical protein
VEDLTFRVASGWEVSIPPVLENVERKGEHYRIFPRKRKSDGTANTTQQIPHEERSLIALEACNSE